MAGSDNNAEIRITANASGVAPGVEQAKGEIQGLAGFVAEVRAGFANLGGTIDELKAQFASFGSTAESSMHGVRTATEAESGALVGMVLRVHEGAEAIRTMQMRAKEFAEIYAGIFLVDRVKEFIGSMAEAAEKVDHLSQRMGLTTSQVQALQGVATGTGMSVDTLAKGLQMMDNRAVTSAGATSSAAKAFQYLGISANDGRSNMERLMIAADKFKDLPDGPDKAALAMQAFGRAGAELIPILDKGSAGIQALMDKTKEYGGVNEEAERKGMRLAEAVNESKIAWEGLKTTLMDALAPSLTGIAEGFSALVARMTTSYETGGAVKQAFDGIVAAGKSIGQILSAIAPLFEALATHIKEVTIALEALALVMIGRYVAAAAASAAASVLASTAIFAIEAVAGGAATALEALGLVAATTGRALLLAFGGPVGLAIAAVTFAVYELISSMNEATTATAKYTEALDASRQNADADRDAIEKLNVAQGEDRKKAEEVAQAHLRAAEAKLKDAQASLALAQMEARHASQELDTERRSSGPSVGMGSGGVGGMGFSPSVGVAAQALKQKEANVQAAKETVDAYAGSIKGLQAALTAPPPNFGGPDLTGTHKGHEKKPKDDTVQNLDEELKQKEAAWDLEQASQGKAQEYSLASITAYWKAALGIEGLSTKDKLDIAERYTSAFRAQTNEENAVYLAGKRKEMDAAKDDEAARLKIATDVYDHEVFLYGAGSREAERAADEVVRIKREAAEKLKRIDDEVAEHGRKMADMEIQAAREGAQFLVQMGLLSQGQLIQQELQLENARYQAEQKGLNQRLAAETAGTLAYTKLQDQLVESKAAHENKMTALTQKAVLQRTAIERQAINQLSSSWGQAIGRMVTLQASFASTIKAMWQGIQQAIGNAVASIIQDWLTKHLTALLLGKAASKAAALSEITTQAGIAGAAGTASYAGAPWPIDMGAPAFGAAMSANAMGYTSFISAEGGAWTVPGGPAMLHPNEMVLPAWAASPLRDMLTGRGANNNAPAAANDGGDHYHYHDHSGTLTPAQIRANKSAFVDMMAEAHRSGAFTRKMR